MIGRDTEGSMLPDYPTRNSKKKTDETKQFRAGDDTTNFEKKVQISVVSSPMK